MRFFNLFSKGDAPEPSPRETLQKLVDYMPAFYDDQRQLILCKEFLEHHEWGLALQSLIDLTEESGHYFSEEFWAMLGDAADKMKMSKERDYCKDQIVRDNLDMPLKIAFGSTLKIDGHHYQFYTSEKLQEERAEKRRKKDGFFNRYPNDGIYVKPTGRAGTIYYVKNKTIAEIDYEIGGTVDLIIFFETLNEWVLPIRKPMTFEEKQLLKDELLAWANSSSATIDMA